MSGHKVGKGRVASLCSSISASKLSTCSITMSTISHSFQSSPDEKMRLIHSLLPSRRTFGPAPILHSESPPSMFSVPFIYIIKRSTLFLSSRIEGIRSLASFVVLVIESASPDKEIEEHKHATSNHSSRDAARSAERNFALHIDVKKKVSIR